MLLINTLPFHYLINLIFTSARYLELFQKLLD